MHQFLKRKILWIVFDFFAMQRSVSSSVRQSVHLSTEWLSVIQEARNWGKPFIAARKLELVRRTNSNYLRAILIIY